VDSASLPLEHRAVYGPPSHLPPPPAYGPPQGGGGVGGGDDPWPLATPDMPQIKHLQVQCEKTNMRVNIEFDRPFYGMIFSKGEKLQARCDQSFLPHKKILVPKRNATAVLKIYVVYIYISCMCTVYFELGWQYSYSHVIQNQHSTYFRVVRNIKNKTNEINMLLVRSDNTELLHMK